MGILPYAETLVATVYHLYRKGTPITQGTLYAVTVRIEANDYANDDEPPSVGGYVHLVVDASSNYVKVLAAFTERPSRTRDVPEWVCVCDHDSAWREDGIKGTLNKAYNEIVKQAVATFGIPAEKLSMHIAIDDMSIASHQDTMGPVSISAVPDGRLQLRFSQ